jgi:hypothetical protein
MNSREREAEKRKARLDDIDDRVADGSLTIRKMTEGERARFGIGDPERPFKRFFFPGTRPGTRRGEDEYQRAARAVRGEAEARPTARRIFRVDTKVKRKKTRLEVGEPIAEGGAVVTAIFELEGGELIVSTTEDAIALRVPAKGAEVLDFS